MIRKYIKFVDPLVRFTFDTMNTTAAERRATLAKGAIVFIRRGPNVAGGGALPVRLEGVKGLPIAADPGNDATELRF